MTRCSICNWRLGHLERVWRGCRRLLPQNSTVASLCTNAVGVVLAVKELATSKIVALDISGCSGEVLGAVCWGSSGVKTLSLGQHFRDFLPPGCCAGNLCEKNVEQLCGGGAAVGECNGGSVGGSCSEFGIHYNVCQ